jgi:phosphatidate cytidylyltransferase
MDFPERPDSAAPRRRRPRPESQEPPLHPESQELEEPAEPPLEERPPEEEIDEYAFDPGEPGPPAPRPRRGETLARVLWAIPAIALAITVIVLGGEIFTAAMIGFACIGLIEFFRMIPRARPFQAVAFATVAGMIAAAHFGDSFQMVLVGVAFFPVMLVAAMARDSLRNVTASMAVTVFAIVWIGVPFAHAVLLRDLPDHGAALLVDVLVATFLVDTCAYAGGRMLGERPLAPRISPNKTVEGLVVGIAGGTAGFWFAGLYQDWLSGTDALLMGICIALLAPLGDLFESMIKRDLDVKDAGSVFGPHGGLLDRLDAVLFTVVAGYYLSLAIVL